MNPHYKKGVLELCVLSMLAGRDCYGYDVSEQISQVVDISDGAVYPILRKLKTDGFVTAYLSEDSGGPARKYYSLTSLGRREYLESKAEWLDFVRRVEQFLEEEGL